MLFLERSKRRVAKTKALLLLLLRRKNIGCCFKNAKSVGCCYRNAEYRYKNFHL
jgi:hypothetical protein